MGMKIEHCLSYIMSVNLSYSLTSQRQTDYTSWIITPSAEAMPSGSVFLRAGCT